MENFPLIVLDASIILKWFIAEEDDNLAENMKKEFVLGKEEIAVPEFLLVEVANVLRYKPSFNKEITKDALN